MVKYFLISATMTIVFGSVPYAAPNPFAHGWECVIQNQLIDCSCRNDLEAASRGYGQRCRDDRVRETKTRSTDLLPVAWIPSQSSFKQRST
jgi:hypothetical protein